MSIKIKHTIAIIGFSLFTSTLIAQGISKKNWKGLRRQLNQNGMIATQQDSFFQQRQKANTITLAITEKNDTWLHVPMIQYIVVLSRKKCMLLKYTKRSVASPGEKSFTIDSFALDTHPADLLISQLNALQPWQIKHQEPNTSDPCGDTGNKNARICTIHDANTLTITFRMNTRAVTSSYYAPEYFEYTCCPGNDERKRFINTVQLIKALFSKTKPGQ